MKNLSFMLVCGLLVSACGSESPGPTTAGPSGTSGSGGGVGQTMTGSSGSSGSGGSVGTGGVPTSMDAASDAMALDDVSTGPDGQPTSDGGGQADVLADTGRADGFVNPDAGSGDGGPLSPAVVQVMRRVADWQLMSAGGSKDWIHGAMWTGYVAVYKATKDPKYLTAIKNWAGAGWGLDGGNGARGDNQCAAQVFFDTYFLDPVPANMVMINGAKGSFDGLVANTPQGRNEWWWEDALFMVPPGFARLGAATGNKQYFATMNTLYWDSYNFLANMQAGLVYRDHRGNDGSFWARGNGWVIAGIARVLEYLPQDDLKRADFVSTFKTMSTALLKVQGSDGLWRSNLLNANQYPNPETSGTAFFTYAFGWGVNNGILDRATYFPAAQKGWDGLVSHVDGAGKLGYVQAVGGAPGPASADSSLPYAIGAFLLAGGELAKLLP